MYPGSRAVRSKGGVRRMTPEARRTRWASTESMARSARFFGAAPERTAQL
jgi:hypothetical protein